LNIQKIFQSYCAPLFYPLAQAFVLNGTRRSLILCTPFWAFVLWTTWAVRNHFFFWDTVQLGSQHAHFFYENEFSNFLLPDEMDSGHPPIFGFYLALMWKTFSKTLIVSHLSMLPFLLGIVWQSFKLGEKLLGEWQAVFFPLILVCNPIMASQGVLVSPDVVLAFFFLMGLNHILARTNSPSYGLTFAILGLAMVSMRGMMVCALLFFFDLWHNYKPIRLSKSYGFVAIRPYILGGTAAFSFLLFHYLKKGWVGYHASSEWVGAFQVVDFQGFVKNMALLGWRLLDFGHIFVALAILISTFLGRRYETFKNTKTLGILLGISILILTPTLLIYKGLLAHRYLLPIYILMDFLALKLISDLKTGKMQIVLFLTVFIGLISGNFWVYPQPISTGWDSTLAHLPYYKLRNEMIQYIDNQGINHTDIGTAFPNLRPSKWVDLVENTEGSHFSALDFEKNHYIFYANVMNDFNKTELDILAKNWQVVKRLDSQNPLTHGTLVEIVLYKRNN
jgi:hypothetical protein